MGSSAQNSSSVHWCRCRVRFNEVPEKVAEVAEPGHVQQGSGEGSGEGRGGFGAEPSGEGSGEGEALVQSQVRFNRVSKKVPEKVGGSGSTGFRRRFWRRYGRLWCRARVLGLGGFGAKPGQVQQGSGEGSGEGRGSFGAEPGQVQQGSGFGARCNRVLKKVPEEVWEALVQSQVRFNKIGFAARFRKICKNKTLGLLGIPPKFFFLNLSTLYHGEIKKVFHL